MTKLQIPTNIIFICWLSVTCVYSKPQYDPLFYGPGRESTETDTAGTILNQHTANSSELNEDGMLMTLTEDRPCPAKCVCFAEKFAHCSRTNLTSFPADLPVTHSTETGGTNNTYPEFEAVFPFSINSLYLGFNEIVHLPNRCLVASGRNLTVLSLTHNQIERISSLAFNGLAKLKQLDLSYNRLRSVTVSLSSRNPTTRATSIFEPVGLNLVSLYLSHNLIRGISLESFANLVNLEILTLSHNEIAWISKNAFKNLEKLRILHIRQNQLSRNTLARLPGVFSSFYNINNVDYRVEFTCLTGLSSLQNLNENELPYNQQNMGENFIPKNQGPMKILDLGKINLNKVPRKLPTSLQILFLDGNLISKIKTNDFKGMVALETLHLSSNQLRIIELGAFGSLYQLQRLDLSNNDLSRLDSNVFCGLISLSNLRLYQNPRITHLPKKIFGNNRSLKVLYLQDCGLRTLPNGPWIYRISAMWLYGNPIDCQCRNVAPIIMKIQNNRKKAFSLDNFRDHIWDGGDTWIDQRRTDTTCATPSRFRGYPVKDIRLRDLYCTGEDFYNITINHQMANMASTYNYYQNDQPAGQSEQPDYTDYDDLQHELKLTDSQYDGHLEKIFSNYKPLSDTKTKHKELEFLKQPNEIMSDLLYSDELGSTKQEFSEYLPDIDNIKLPDTKITELFNPVMPNQNLHNLLNLDDPEYAYREFFTEKYIPDYPTTNDTELDQSILNITKTQTSTNNTSQLDQISNLNNLLFNISDDYEYANLYTSNLKASNLTIENSTTEKKDSETTKSQYENIKINEVTNKQMGATWLFEIPPQANFYEDILDTQSTTRDTQDDRYNNDVTNYILQNVTSLSEEFTSSTKLNAFTSDIFIEPDSQSNLTLFQPSVPRTKNMTSQINAKNVISDVDSGLLIDEYEYPEGLLPSNSEYVPDPDYESSGASPESEGEVLTPGEYLVFKNKLARANINDEYDLYYFDSIEILDSDIFLEDELLNVG